MTIQRNHKILPQVNSKENDDESFTESIESDNSEYIYYDIYDLEQDYRDNLSFLQKIRDFCFGDSGKFEAVLMFVIILAGWIGLLFRLFE